MTTKQLASDHHGQNFQTLFYSTSEDPQRRSSSRHMHNNVLIGAGIFGTCPITLLLQSVAAGSFALHRNCCNFRSICMMDFLLAWHTYSNLISFPCAFSIPAPNFMIRESLTALLLPTHQRYGSIDPAFQVRVLACMNISLKRGKEKTRVKIHWDIL